MIARHLCDVQMGLYASPEYLASVGGVASPDALAQLKRISWFSGRERNPFVWELESEARRFVLQAGDGMQFDEPDVAISACMAGSGICPGAPFAVAGFVRSGGSSPCYRTGTFRPSGAYRLPRLQALVGSRALLCELDPGGFRRRWRSPTDAQCACCADPHGAITVTQCRAGVLSDFDHHFALGTACCQIIERFLGLLERKHPVDHWLDAS